MGTHSSAKEPIKRDDILQKRPVVLRSPRTVATPYLSTYRIGNHDSYHVFTHYSPRIVRLDMYNSSLHVSVRMIRDTYESCFHSLQHRPHTYERVTSHIWMTHIWMRRITHIWMTHCNIAHTHTHKESQSLHCNTQQCTATHCTHCNIAHTHTHIETYASETATCQSAERHINLNRDS